GLRIDPEHVLLLLLERLHQAFVVALDAVARIGEPDRAVRCDREVVWRVELLAVVFVGDDGDRAVELGAGDAAAAVLAGDEPPLAIDGVAVRVHRRLAEYA